MTEEPAAGPLRRLTRATLLDVIALCGLALVTLAFFRKIALTNQVLSGVDLFAYFYPYRDLASEALRQGRLPLWNPYLFMGAPLLANSQVAVLYPLHWPLLWLPVPKQIAWSIVLHTWIAGAGTYLFARRVMHRGRPASLAGAAVFALGGFLGAQAEHINQLNASVWMPWLLLCLEGAANRPAGAGRRLAFLAGSVVIALMLLAGHTQAAYIVLAGAGLYALLRGAPQGRGSDREFAARWKRAVGRLRAPGLLAGMAVVALLLAAGQLLPTLELSRLSVRSGGLDYREAVSFSLRPDLVLRAFLPPLLWEPPFSEFVAYAGLTGLALAGWGAAAAVRSLRQRTPVPQPGDAQHAELRRFALPSLGLAFAGAFLAFGAYNPAYYVLYKVVPGISLFRAPARWLLLYAFGVAVLAAIGLDQLAALRRLPRRLGRWAAPFVVLILLGELLLCGRKLAHNRPTAPAAYDSMRSATAHLLADDDRLFRFLSLSDILYDPGDLGDLQALFGTELSQDALYKLFVATKMKEVLAYNLPLRYRLFSVDGYDGGLLPTSRYVALEHLFLDAGDIWPDGRLRQQLKSIPPNRLLSLLNVRYVITDKVQDAWHEGVYYDLEAQVPLGEVELERLPGFEATRLGVVSYLTGTADLPTGTPVAEAIIESGDEVLLAATLRAGYETAEGRYVPGSVAHDLVPAIHHWRDDTSGSDYLAILDLPQAARPSRISVRSLLPEGSPARVVLRGMSLIDARTGTSASLPVDPALNLVHSGDVKVYENLAALPRAFVVHAARVASSDEDAIGLLKDAGLDPAREVVLAEAPLWPAGGQPGGAGPAAGVEVVHYGAEQIDLRASLGSPGYLVLSDAFYPGWQAEVDGRTVPILRADIYFRAVALEAGTHRVTFRYRPASVRWGLAIGGAAWAGCALALAVLALRAGRMRRNRV